MRLPDMSILDAEREKQIRDFEWCGRSIITFAKTKTHSFRLGQGRNGRCFGFSLLALR
jgi:hypothetical protein